VRAAVVGAHADALAAPLHFHGAQHLHEPAPAVEAADARLEDGLHPGPGAAIEDGQLDIGAFAFHFDEQVLHFQAHQGRKQVLDGLEAHAILHEGRGQLDVARELGGDRDLHAGARVAEPQARGLGDGDETHAGGPVAVEPMTRDRDLVGQGLGRGCAGHGHPRRRSCESCANYSIIDFI